MISNEEYGLRMASLQQQVAASDLDAYIVTNEENIYYLTGVSYKQQERPFFIIVRPEPPVVLLTPALEGEHLGNAPNIDQVIWYWDYPSPPGEGWNEKLNDILDSTMAIGVEPSLKLEIVEALSEHEYRILPSGGGHPPDQVGGRDRNDPDRGPFLRPGRQKNPGGLL